MAILDRDSRSEAQVRKLESEKIQILSVEEIESVVYGKDAVYTIARILEDNFNSPVTRSIQKVENRLKQIFTTNSSLSKLAETTAEKRLHHSALDHLASLTLSDADSGRLSLFCQVLTGKH